MCAAHAKQLRSDETADTEQPRRQKRQTLLGAAPAQQLPARCSGRQLLRAAGGHLAAPRHRGPSPGLATITYAHMANQAAAGAAGARAVDATMAQRCLDELVSLGRFLTGMGQNPYRLIANLRSYWVRRRLPGGEGGAHCTRCGGAGGGGSAIPSSAQALTPPSSPPHRQIFSYGWHFPSDYAYNLVLAAQLAGGAINATEASQWRDMAAQQQHCDGRQPAGARAGRGVASCHAAAAPAPVQVPAPRAAAAPRPASRAVAVPQCRTLSPGIATCAGLQPGHRAGGAAGHKCCGPGHAMGRPGTPPRCCTTVLCVRRCRLLPRALPPRRQAAAAALRPPLQEAPWPGQLIGLSGGFSWVNAFGAGLGKTFPVGSDYPTLPRSSDCFNVNTELVVPNVAAVWGVLGVLMGLT